MHLPWGQWCSPTYANSSSERTGCLGLPPLSVRAHKAVDWVTSSANICCGRRSLIYLWGGPLSHMFNGRYICLWVQPWQTLPVASLNKPLCLIPCLVACRNMWRMTAMMRPSISYLGYLSKNNSASRHHSASLIDSPTSLPLLPGGLGPMQFVPIVQF